MHFNLLIDACEKLFLFLNYCKIPPILTRLILIEADHKTRAAFIRCILNTVSNSATLAQHYANIEPIFSVPVAIIDHCDPCLWSQWPLWVVTVTCVSGHSDLWRSVSSRAFCVRLPFYIHCYTITRHATPANTKHWTNVGSMLTHRLRRWSNIDPTLYQCLVFAGTSAANTRHSPDVGLMVGQRRRQWTYRTGSNAPLKS